MSRPVGVGHLTPPFPAITVEADLENDLVRIWIGGGAMEGGAHTGCSDAQHQRALRTSFRSLDRVGAGR